MYGTANFKFKTRTAVVATRSHIRSVVIVVLLRYRNNTAPYLLFRISFKPLYGTECTVPYAASPEFLARSRVRMVNVPAASCRPALISSSFPTDMQRHQGNIPNHRLVK